MCQKDNGVTVTKNSTVWSCCTNDRSNQTNQIASHDGISAPIKPELQRSLSTNISSLSAIERQKQDEIDAQCKLIDIIQYCQENRIHFVDDQFLPSNRSIGAEPPIASVSQWLRIREISSDNNNSKELWTVMSNPHPNDIAQGYLGDCWLMAALALITERPDILSHILLTPIINEEGVYLVRICHNGLWKIVLIDDCFPCTKNKRLVFAKARHRQLFVPLIEKACAKIWGSYNKLTGGFMYEALHLLTGAPSEKIQLNVTANDDNDNRDLLWAKLVSACEANLLMGASTGNSDLPAEEYQRVHLSRNHVFSVLAYHDLSYTERFLLLRDPHGSSKYTDDFICPDILQQLQQIKTAEAINGTFWMSWLVFLRFFGSLIICAYRDNLFDVRYEGKFTRHSAQTVQAYYFHVEKSTTITMGLFHQRSDREKDNYRHTQAFVLCDILNTEIGQRETVLRSSRSAYTEWTGTLSSGAYVLIPFSTSYWHRETNNEAEEEDEINYTVVIHSSTKLDILITEESGKVLADCLIANIVQHHRIIKKSSNYTLYISKEPGAYLIPIVGENTSTEHALNVDIDVSKSLNIRHSRNTSITFDSIPSQHRQIHLLVDYIYKSGENTRYRYTYLCAHNAAERRPTQPNISRADDIHAARPIYHGKKS
ncbi:unnamed protein product [Adineta ricciae]|nr:unnamed protein product [Adineta ricciae]